jgi:hypothetical protein
MRVIKLVAFALLLCWTHLARAGGPRFVTGPPFFTAPAGQPIGWKQPQLLYYTDPGALSTVVNHQASDALVAAAAGVWNLPVASITIAQGGALAEHVSGQNVYLDTSGLVFPNDVMSSNAAAIPIAVVYDTDGSVTDLLLGSGASLPSGCRQNAVTESVDSFDPAGYILHAVVIVNGRCTGAAPELQLELQYQLMRAFGRVLGLAWSQTNDNVFTGTPTPTSAQAMNWPIMHPLDIICGPYAYQCLPSPFELRPDDIASMVAVYPTATSLADAHTVSGHVYFPTGEGMAGVNVLVTREPLNTTSFDTWYEASAVTGAGFRTAASSPFVVADDSAWSSFGSLAASQSGAYLMAYVPLEPGLTVQNIRVSTEPVNPLYIGSYSLGPYALGAVVPSGSPVSKTATYISAGTGANFDITVPDAASTCGNGQDGTASSPMALPATGWWNGLLCGYGHASYVTAAVRPGRSFTVEITALDEQGVATEAKAMPVIGLFAPTDQPGDLPSLGVTQTAFAGSIAGMTSIGAATDQLTSLTVGIADQRGDGRPDFNYQARFFYADSVIPAELPTAGGSIAITGSGFRPGNAVTINGVAATVVSWTANNIVVTAPSMSAANAANGTAVDIVVSDRTTGASSTMSAALTYTAASALPNTMRLVSAPSGTQYTGVAATTPFAVQLLAPDGVTPVANQQVVFTAQAGSVTFSACPAASCTMLTDSNGMASVGVTVTAAGAVTLQADDGALSQSASFTAQAEAGSLQIWLAPSGNQPVNLVAGLIALTDRAPSGSPQPGRSVTFTATAGSATFSACSTSICTVTTDQYGNALTNVTPTSLGVITIQAADGNVTSTISFTSVSNTDVMQIATAPIASAYVGNNSGNFAVNLFHADGVTPDFNQTVVFTAAPGVLLYPCISNICAASTGWSGQAGVGIVGPAVGAYTIQAAFGSVTQSASFALVPHTLQLNIVSAPTTAALGTTAPTPFSVQLLEDGVTPIGNATIALAAPVGLALLGSCGYLNASCGLTSDGNGMVSTTVTPLKPGAITLSALSGTAIATTTLLATGPPETINILQQPPPTVFVGDTVNFTVQFTAPGGGPLVNDFPRFIILSGPFGFSDLSNGTVQRTTDGNGIASEIGSAGAPGTIAVMVSDGVVSQTFTFTAIARPDQMRLISAPASGGYVNVPAPTPFAVQLLEYDGVTAAANRSVTVAVTNGSASLTGCGGSPSCTLVTDSQGVLTTAVTPLSVGTITLSASENGAVQTATFTTLGAPAADVFSMVNNPGAALYVGATATNPFAVLVTLADGVTPVAGVPIVFYTSGQGTGAVQFGACASPSCNVVTGADGIASTTVTGVAAGALTLSAIAALPSGDATVSTALQVVANELSIAALNPATYIMEGAPYILTLTANLIENGAPAVGQTVEWNTTPGFAMLATSSVTDATGVASNQALLGPLPTGIIAGATACAQINAQPSVCAQFSGYPVAASALQLSIQSGAAQSVAGSTPLSPVVVVVQDDAGHPVVAAPVSIYQTVTAYTACPARGRCPAAQVLASQATVATSGLDGTITLVPLTVGGAPTQTEIALSAGTQGFATTTLTSQP